MTRFIAIAEIILRKRLSLIRSKLKQSDCFLVILPNTFSFIVTDPEPGDPFGIFLIRGQAEPLYCFIRIRGNGKAVIIQSSQVKLCVRIPGFSSRQEIFQCLFIIFLLHRFRAEHGQFRSGFFL